MLQPEPLADARAQQPIHKGDYTIGHEKKPVAPY